MVGTDPHTDSNNPGTGATTQRAALPTGWELQGE